MVEALYKEEDVKAFLDYFEATSERNYLMWVTGISTGLRIGDLLHLKVKDVRKKEKFTIKMQKNNKNITIPIPKDLQKIYKKYLTEEKYNNYDYIFKSRKGENCPIEPPTAYRIIKNVGDIHRIKNIGTHTMRKTYGLNTYIKCGRDISHVQERLGHKDHHTTLSYIGLNEEYATQVANSKGFFNLSD